MQKIFFQMYNVVLFIDEGTPGIVRESWFSLGSDVSFIISIKLLKCKVNPPPPILVIIKLFPSELTF